MVYVGVLALGLVIMLLWASFSTVYVWGVLFLLSLSFLFYGVVYRVSPVLLFVYIVFQEYLSFLFLVGISADFQGYILLLKVGVPPFHYWGFFFVSELSGYVLFWFLVVLKMVPLPVLLEVSSSMSFVLLLGVIVVSLQMFGSCGLGVFILLSSSESLVWLLLLGCYCGSAFSLVFGCLYFLGSLTSGGAFTSYALTSQFFGLWVASYVSTLTFFIKYAVLMLSSSSGVSFLILLLVVPLTLYTTSLSLVYSYVVSHPEGYAGGSLYVPLSLVLVLLVL